MGTSKGYISPTRIEWTNAKRSVGQMIKNPSAESISKAASRFSTAMKSDMASAGNATFISAATSILGFVNRASSQGIDAALKEIDREDLIGRDSSEIWDELLYMYTNEGESDEDSLALDALSLATKNLNIDLERLSEIQSDVFLRSEERRVGKECM